MEMNALSDLCHAVASLLNASKRVLFITGGGVSADSGVPTYRGVGGLGCHTSDDPLFDIERELDFEVMAHDPARAWRTIRTIERESRGAAPNDAHARLSAFCQSRPGAWTLTRNVDGLHRRADTPNLIEINGNLRDLECTACSWHESVVSFDGLDATPHCPSCGRVVRPRCSLVGEPPIEHAMRTLERELATGFDVVACIGASSDASFVADLLGKTRERGIPTIEINPGMSVVAHESHVRLPVSPAIGVASVFEQVQMPPPRAA